MMNWELGIGEREEGGERPKKTFETKSIQSIQILHNHKYQILFKYSKGAACTPHHENETHRPMMTMKKMVKHKKTKKKKSQRYID